MKSIKHSNKIIINGSIESSLIQAPFYIDLEPNKAFTSILK